MNENHQRHLISSFRHIDGLLSEAGRVLAVAGSSSPFAEFTQNSTPVQRKVIEDYIQRVREVLLRAMADLHLPRPSPTCGALWALRTQVTFISIAVAEMESKRLRGFGTLADDDARAVDRITAELNAALDRLSAYLDEGPDGDLQARLQMLDQTRNEVALLRELERIVTTHGLVEFRGTLAVLLDRLESSSFEIGIFGRVSSGKSSLLNQLLDADVLPVGVTPVTAVPTRIQFGLERRATVAFAESKPITIELARLAEFSTEQQNPANAKHVTRLLVEVPAPRLQEGVTFVDTPGLGSLATSGAEETAAYLPRCDLGIVLMDAASTLTHEDLAVAKALYQSGAHVMLLVSKADLLQPADLQRMLRYASEQLRAQLGVETPVHAVSVVPGQMKLCDEWFDHDLKPLLETHQEQAAASLRRKTGALRESVMRTLEAHVTQTGQDIAGPAQDHADEALKALRQADVLSEDAQRKGNQIADETASLAETIIETGVAELATAWTARPPVQTEAGPLFAAALARMLAAHSTKLLASVEAARLQLVQTLAVAHAAFPNQPDGAEPLPKLPPLPVFDAAGAMSGLVLPMPPVLPWFGAALLRRYAQWRLREPLREPLDRFLSQQRQSLRQWLSQSIAEMRGSFDTHAGPLRAQLEARISNPIAEPAAHGMADDLQRLRDWQA
jgi:small GTP-binding protein